MKPLDLFLILTIAMAIILSLYGARHKERMRRVQEIRQNL